MKGLQVVHDDLDGRPAAALMRDGVLDDFLLSAPDDAPPVPGSIFRAITDRPLKGQGGMMMKLPGGDMALFRGAKGLKPGEPLLVQVTSYAEAGKAVPVTDRIIFKGRYVIVTPGAAGINVSRQIRDEEEKVRLLEILHQFEMPEGIGLIVRSSAEGAAEDDIAAEAEHFLGLAVAVLNDADTQPELLVDGGDAQEVAEREWPVAETVDGFEAHGVLDALALLDTAEVTLGGTTLFIEPTRALVAVDVNTGGDFSPASGLKANLACARALPRELRLRGLGGQITLDLAPMAKKDRKQFEQALRSAFKADPVETALVGWTPLGHYELQRKRERLPLPKGIA
ncbi:ribonuclease E/G [uncultured Litoreibacter sp.]|uniref:ribonuclease E/G n=1 Tax=uncultured Litoreibacter sp. TaxID=1392394 RepID=UPI00261D04A4|nr:ribonuclease E/G [uncultured Litoreibacter sp.]